MVLSPCPVCPPWSSALNTMKSDAVAFGIAGVLFGLIAGWVIGSQQAVGRPPVAAAAPVAQQAPAGGGSGTSRAAVIDETQVNALKTVAERETANATPRTQLGNLYFDAERYDEAIKWYGEAVKLSPKDVNVSTDTACRTTTRTSPTGRWSSSIVPSRSTRST